MYTLIEEIALDLLDLDTSTLLFLVSDIFVGIWFVSLCVCLCIFCFLIATIAYKCLIPKKFWKSKIYQSCKQRVTSTYKKFCTKQNYLFYVTAFLIVQLIFITNIQIFGIEGYDISEISNSIKIEDYWSFLNNKIEYIDNKEFTDDYCNDLDCSLIPKPLVFKPENLSALSYTAKSLLKFSNHREREIYKISQYMCEKLKMKLDKNFKKYQKAVELYKQSNEKPVVTIFWKKIDAGLKTYHHNFLKGGVDEENCRVQIVFSNKIRNSDVFLCHRPMHCRKMLKSAGEYILLNKTQFCFESQLHHLSHNIATERFLKYNFDHSETVVGHLPFSDVPLHHYSFNYWKTRPKSYLDCPEIFNANFSRDLLIKNFREKDDVLACTLTSGSVSIGMNYAFFRKYYISEMERYTKIDHYGGYGFSTRPVPPGNESKYSDIYKHKKWRKRGRHGRYCEKMLLYNKYKFSIAMENSRSYGYFTEKLRHAILAQFTIPIYYGSKNAEVFFRHYIPKKYKVYIDVMDFPDPKKLVEYMEYLANNETAYLEYFQWRFDGYTLEKLEKEFNVHSYFSDIACRIGEYHHFGRRICKLKKGEIKHKFVDRMMMGYR